MQAQKVVQEQVIQEDVQIAQGQAGAQARQQVQEKERIS
jgi:hypothetical protein